MVNPKIAESFINSVLPGDLRAESVEVLSNALNPLASIEEASQFIHRDSTRKMIGALKRHADMGGNFKLALAKRRTIKQGGSIKGGSKFIKQLINAYDSLTKALPKKDYDAQTDYTCRLSTGELVNVEVQIAPRDHWKRRALFYASLMYAHQMKRGSTYEILNRVILISLCGGGHTPTVWTTPYQYWQLKDQHGTPFTKGIEFIQLPLFHRSLEEHKEVISAEKKISYEEWMKFWEYRQKDYDQAKIEEIQTPEIKLALDITDLGQHPELKEEIEQDKRRLELVSDYVAQQVKETAERVERETTERVARETAERVKYEMKEKEKHVDEERIKKLIGKGLTNEDIVDLYPTVTEEKLNQLRQDVDGHK